MGLSKCAVHPRPLAFIDLMPVGGFNGYVYFAPVGTEPPAPEPQRPAPQADNDDDGDGN